MPSTAHVGAKFLQVLEVQILGILTIFLQKNSDFLIANLEIQNISILSVCALTKAI
jgi:hypothetical protein